MALMRGVSDGRAGWLARNILPHEPALRAWLRSRRLAGLDIDDIVQEAYTRLIAIDDVEHILHPKTYFFQAAYSVAVSQMRHAKVIPIATASDLDMLAAASNDPSPEQQVADQDELLRLAEAIAALPGKTRDVFELRRVEGLSQREVAERLGLAESTVEKHMSRGFLLMQNLFGRGGKPEVHASKLRKPSDRDNVEEKRRGN